MDKSVEKTGLHTHGCMEAGSDTMQGSVQGPQSVRNSHRLGFILAFSSWESLSEEAKAALSLWSSQCGLSYSQGPGCRNRMSTRMDKKKRMGYPYSTHSCHGPHTHKSVHDEKWFFQVLPGNPGTHACWVCVLPQSHTELSIFLSIAQIGLELLGERVSSCLCPLSSSLILAHSEYYSA